MLHYRMLPISIEPSGKFYPATTADVASIIQT